MQTSWPWEARLNRVCWRKLISPDAEFRPNASDVNWAAALHWQTMGTALPQDVCAETSIKPAETRCFHQMLQLHIHFGFHCLCVLEWTGGNAGCFPTRTAAWPFWSEWSGPSSSVPCSSEKWLTSRQRSASPRSTRWRCRSRSWPRTSSQVRPPSDSHWTPAAMLQLWFSPSLPSLTYVITVTFNQIVFGWLLS